MELLDKVTPVLETIRTTIIWISDKIANAFTLNPENVYLIVISILSIWGGKKIFDTIYSNTEGRWGYWVAISGAIFLILKYLGIPS